MFSAAHLVNIPATMAERYEEYRANGEIVRVRMTKGVSRISEGDDDLVSYYYKGRAISNEPWRHGPYTPWSVATGRIADTRRMTHKTFSSLGKVIAFLDAQGA
jgi:hypothetical protein